MIQLRFINKNITFFLIIFIILKGRCTRENPKCKYLHPPQHLKDQLLINGRQHLQLKNQICSQLTSHSPAGMQPSIPLIAQLVVNYKKYNLINIYTKKKYF